MMMMMMTTNVPATATYPTHNENTEFCKQLQAHATTASKNDKEHQRMQPALENCWGVVWGSGSVLA
eukprot:517333-Amphidinium_carterae.1